MTGEILQKFEMVLTERIEDKSSNNGKSMNDLISLNWLKSTTLQLSEMTEEINQPIQFILGL